MRIRVLISIVFAMLVAPLAVQGAKAIEYGPVATAACVPVMGEVGRASVQGAMCLDASGTALTLVATLRDGAGNVRRGLIARGTVEWPTSKGAPRRFRVDDLSTSLIDVEGSCPSSERHAAVQGKTLQAVAESFGDWAIRVAFSSRCVVAAGQP